MWKKVVVYASMSVGFTEESHIWLGDMAQWVKCLLHKCEDLSLSLQNSRGLDMVVLYVCYPRTPSRRQELETGGSLETCGPASLACEEGATPQTPDQ